jgi:serpin B
MRRPATALLVATLALAACGGGTNHGTNHGTNAGGRGGDEAKATLAQATGTPAEARAGAASVDAFGQELFARLLAGDSGNVAVSPWSVATALAMAADGAGGTTAAQMVAVLHATDPASLDQDLGSLDVELEARNTATVRLLDADRAFVQKGLAIEQPFLDRLATSYGAGVGLVDFDHDQDGARQTINTWVSDQTAGKIPQLIGQGVPLTALVLVNAVYLKGAWTTPFQTSATTPGPFQAPGGSVTVPFMHATEDLTLATGAGWQAVELPYGSSGQLEMTVVLPDAGQALTPLTAAELQAVDNAPTVHVALALPKFDVSSAHDLSPELEAMGMPEAFSDAADFSGITSPSILKISAVLHQAVVTVDEQGTVAAAATGDVFATAAAAPEPTRPFVVDRPFAFYIRDKPTGAVLFEGVITNPR